MIVMEGFSSKKFSTFALLLSGELQPWDAMGARTVITGIAGSTTTGTSKCREQNFPSQLPSPWKVYRPLHLVLAESRNDKRNTFQCQYISCVYVCVCAVKAGKAVKAVKYLQKSFDKVDRELVKQALRLAWQCFRKQPVRFALLSF